LGPRTSMRFQPNSRASMDHAPGPTSAKATPMVAMKMQAEGSPGRTIMLRTASAASNKPTIGVHNPASRSSPIRIANIARTDSPMGGPVCSLTEPWMTSEAPATTRISRRPAPGQPGAKVENNRRKYPPDKQSGYRIDKFAESPERVGGELFRVF